MKKQGFFYRNGLSIVLFVLMFASLSGQMITGWNVFNKEQQEAGLPALQFWPYLHSGHFIQATFENWESEFLQMMLYVVLTVFLRQKGSGESKSLEKTEEVDREPEPHPRAPWPVKKGGAWLWWYKRSLSLALALLFILSFLAHFYGSFKDFNQEAIRKGQPAASAFEYAGEPRFWFESFQNWQSEFLAVASLVLLSIWFRQKGSPQSKPVDMPDDETA
ncbi:hypothetical protein LQ567_02310 [Niabella pedocola]|uniref:DUF4149 domain-containing protein n=1 Tax=Niabella pedocola TaxID=1752077 RepID=A0ABS8PMQ3_9BACT|nr:DUF6766 family protein [Niabella pedocola]MCD2421577.1 hypothetical protein [Niabella pedocola]